jgi:hypothetical protein
MSKQVVITGNDVFAIAADIRMSLDNKYKDNSLAIFMLNYLMSNSDDIADLWNEDNENDKPY